MKNLFFLTIILLSGIQGINAQKYFSKTAYVSFFSDTKMEKIEGHNKSSSCVLDIATGKVEFASLIKGFQFEKALMQEHFNENYMESNKYPKATFKGQIDNYSKIDMSNKSKADVTVTGELTMHGITKKMTLPATLVINNGKIESKSEFYITIADFDVVIPALVKDQISKTIKVNVTGTLELLK